MTPKARLNQRLTQLEAILEWAELDLEELRIEGAKTQINAGLLILKELLGSTQNCTCLAFSFPHKRGIECPEKLT